MEDSARRCYTQKPEDMYTHGKFGLKIFASKSFNSGFRTTIARVRNCLAQALLEVATPLPKILFIFLEDDVIKDIRENDGLPHIYRRCIEWLHHEIHKLLAAHNDHLPNNAKREVFVTWVLPSRHMNYANDGKCELFADCIKNVIQINNEKSLALAIKQSWDQYDPSVYLYDCQRYSAEGLNRLWKAFDRTVWYANICVGKIENRKLQDQTGHANQQLNHFSSGTRGRPGYRGRGRGRTYYGNKKFYTKFGKHHEMAKLPPPPEQD